MNPSTVLLPGRRMAESMMVDACTLSHWTGESTNDATGAVTPTYGAAYYSGPCRVQVGEALAMEQGAGERVQVTGRLVLSVPMSVTGVTVDDRVTVTASLSDPDLVGRTFRVREMFHKSFATARRLRVEEQQS